MATSNLIRVTGTVIHKTYMMLGYTAFLNTSNNDCWSSNMTFRLHIDNAKLFFFCARDYG